MVRNLENFLSFPLPVALKVQKLERVKLKKTVIKLEIRFACNGGRSAMTTNMLNIPKSTTRLAVPMSRYLMKLYSNNCFAFKKKFIENMLATLKMINSSCLHFEKYSLTVKIVNYSF